MKTFSFSPSRLLLAVVLTMGLSALTVSADTYQFNNDTGGSGTWQDGSGGTPWKDLNTAASNLQWNNAVANVAQFDKAAGTVDVEGNVSATNLLFSATGAEILNGSGTITTTSGNLVLQNNTTNAVTIDNNLLLDDSITSDRFDISDASSTGSTITLNGDISYTGSSNRGTSGQALIFNGKANSDFILNGSFSGTAANPGRILLYGGGTLTLNGNYTGPTPSAGLLEVDAGNVILGTSQTGMGTINLLGSPTVSTTLLTSGAQTIANGVGVQNLNTGTSVPGMTFIGGSTADVSTYSGNIGVVVSGLTVTAAAGGQVNFTGVINNNITTGLIKTGAGTVKLSGANTYGIKAYDSTKYPNGTIAADIQQGTLLIANTTGSAFGTNTGQVQIESGAILGGSGISTETVVSMAADAVIAPGTQATVPTVLHLNGGLTEENGLTMDFKLSGDSSDRIDLGGGDLHLDGLLTINLTGTPTVDDANGGKFILISNYNAATVTGDPSQFVINAPAGYEVTGIDVDNDIPGLGNYVYVQLAAVPEPSTYALLLLGGAGLLSLARRRRVTA